MSDAHRLTFLLMSFTGVCLGIFQTASARGRFATAFWAVITVSQAWLVLWWIWRLS